MTLAAMRYMGGKSSQSPHGIGKWVASLLPPSHRHQMYVEPFCGMLGILLQRKPAGVELANDASEHVINWWRVLRDRKDDMAHHISMIPHSRHEYNEACDRLRNQEGDSFQKAVDFTVATMQGRTAKVGSGWMAGFDPNGTLSWKWQQNLVRQIDALAERIRHVSLECGRGERIVKNVVKEDHAMVYIDPPYYSSRLAGLYEHDMDADKLTKYLRNARAEVAISGYGEEWDHLGWHRHEYATFRARPGVHPERRVEVVWTNYEAGAQGKLL